MEKLMMNKLDVMELDMVAGGALSKRKGREDEQIHVMIKNGVNKVLDGTGKLLGKLLPKIKYF